MPLKKETLQTLINQTHDIGAIKKKIVYFDAFFSNFIFLILI